MNDKKQFGKISKALADPRRLEVLEFIAGQDAVSCGSIAEHFPVRQSTISHHLKILVDSGLVDVRREGQFGYFSSQPDVVQDYLSELHLRLIRDVSRPQASKINLFNKETKL